MLKHALRGGRGGGEYGITWREAGSLHNKQNVFDDFISCANLLVQQGYTCPAKLVIQVLLATACWHTCVNKSRLSLSFAPTSCKVAVSCLCHYDVSPDRRAAATEAC